MKDKLQRKEGMWKDDGKKKKWINWKSNKEKSMRINK